MAKLKMYSIVHMYCIYKFSTDNIISFSQNLSLGFILKIFFKFLINREECIRKCYSSFASMYSVISC